MYLRSGETRVLVDCGISAKQLRLRLAEHSVQLEEIDAIFVTHEHSDHIRGLEVVLKQHSIPVFATEGTSKACVNSGRFSYEQFVQFNSAKPINFQSLELWPFAIPHDASEPVMFRIESSFGSLAIATDMGHVAPHVPEYLQGVDALVLEANHCPELLKTAPYPASVKKRIYGDRGHLSNQVSSELFTSITRADVLPQVVVAAHISENSNTPELALDAIRNANQELFQEARLVAGSPTTPTELFSLQRDVSHECFEEVF